MIEDSPPIVTEKSYVKWVQTEKVVDVKVTGRCAKFSFDYFSEMQ